MKFIMVLALATSSAWAGNFEILGEGSASSPAEFVRVKMNIRAECFSSALSARQNVNVLTLKALEVLEKFKSAIPAQLSVSPDSNEQVIKSAYIEGREVVICDENHSWVSSTVIDFKLEDLKQLAQLQDDLLRLNIEKVPSNAINTARTSLALSKPLGGVLGETWDAMSDRALERAYKNALRQAKVLSQGINNPQIKLLQVTAAIGSDGRPIYDRVDAEGDTSGLSLGNVSIKLARKFIFQVEGQ